MKKRLKFLLTYFILIMLAIAVFGCGESKQEPPAQPAAQPVELNISAAVSLKDALTEIQTKYQEKAPNVHLVYNMGSSGAMQKQIEQGAPADIFISAATKEMDELDAKNLVNKATRKNLVGNKLVLIVPKDSNLKITTFEELTQDSIKKIAIGEPNSVPAGQYAQQTLQKLGLWDKVKDKLVFTKDVRTVLTYVEAGNIDAGVVYYTDALSSNKVKAVATAEENLHDPIIYPIAILSGTKNQKAAEDFLAYLLSPDGKEIFEKYGFITTP